MELKRVTYGAPGLMEWQAVLNVGATVLRVPFSGGTVTAYGVSPAKFTTDNPMYQKIIERSSEFAKGKIVVLNSVDIDGEPKVKIGHNAKKSKAAKTAETVNTEAAAETAAYGAESGQEADSADGAEAGAAVADTEQDGSAGADGACDAAPAEAESDADAEESAEEADEDGTKEVEVACLDDAAEYLKEKFGVAKRQVRSKESANSFAEANGVKFVWV